MTLVQKVSFGLRKGYCIKGVLSPAIKYDQELLNLNVDNVDKFEVKNGHGSENVRNDT